jgi:hypothetical protein
VAAPLAPVGNPLEPNANAAEPEAAQPQLEALASAHSPHDRLPALVSICAEGKKCPNRTAIMLLQLNYSSATEGFTVVTLAPFDRRWRA